MACCWVCQHADGEQGECSQHLGLSNHSGLGLTQEVSEIGKSRVLSSTRSEDGAKVMSEQPEAGSYDNRLAGAYISARIACGYVLRSSYSNKM